MNQDKPVFMLNGMLVYVQRTFRSKELSHPDLLQLEYVLENNQSVVVNYQQAYAGDAQVREAAAEFFDKLVAAGGGAVPLDTDRWPHFNQYADWKFTGTDHNDFCVVKTERLYRLSGSHVADVVCEFAQYMLEVHQLVMVMGTTRGNNHTPEFVFRKL